MNGLNYTSISFIEMNVVVSTSVVRRFVDVFLPWVHCYFVCGAVLRGFLSARSALSYWFDAERILRGRVVSPAALQFL